MGSSGWFARVGRGIRRLPRPTRSGFLLLVLALLSGVVGLAASEAAVLRIHGLLAAVVLLSFVLPLWDLRGLRVERHPPAHGHAGEPFAVTTVLATSARRSSWAVVLRDAPFGPTSRPGHAFAYRVRPGEAAVVRYRVRIRDRGRHRISDYELSTRFPFGFFEHRVRSSVVSDMIVFPRLGRFREDPLPSSRFSRLMTSTETVHEVGQEEFRNLREYRPGDSPRRIAWRATARHGALMVKEMEDDLSKRVTIFLESRLPPGSGSRGRLRLERAVSFTATLIRRLARRRTDLHLYYFAPGPRHVAGGRGARHLDRIMEGLAVLEPSGDGEIGDLVRLAPEEGLLRSLPVLILPTDSEVRLRDALGRIPGRHPPVVFRMDGEWERRLFAHDDTTQGIRVR